MTMMKAMKASIVQILMVAEIPIFVGYIGIPQAMIPVTIGP